MFNYSVNNYL